MEAGITSLNIHKLGHKIEEIRTRTLNNIIFKLDHGFVEEKELATRKDLFVKLLEWFNFDNCPEKEKVLNLLLRLAKVDGCPRLLYYMGAVTILSALRSSTSVDLHPLVDALIDAINTSAGSSYDGDGEDHDEQEEFVEEEQYILDHNALHAPSEGDYGYSEGESSQEVPARSSCAPVEARMKGDGYFHQKQALSHLVPDTSQSFKHLLLPWQPLLSTDNQVLLSIETSLQSEDETILLSTCGFFIDVMLQDFPAEVFLQRCGIVKVLLQLLDMSHLKSKPVTIAIVKCLRKLSISIYARLNYYCDPCIANMKMEVDMGWVPNDLNISGFLKFAMPNTSNEPMSDSSYARSTALDSRGDPLEAYLGNKSQVDASGDSLENVPFSNQHYQDYHIEVGGFEEDTVLLQLKQMTLPQYCLNILVHVVPHLTSSDQCKMNEMIPLTADTIKLLCSCVSSSLWTSTDSLSLETSDLLKDICRIFGETLDFHRALFTDGSSDSNQYVPYHRLAYLQVLFLIRKLIKLIPHDQAEMVIPRNLKTALAASVFDCGVFYFYPDIHADILSYVEIFHEEAMKYYGDILTVFKAIKSSVQFLRNWSSYDDVQVFTVLQQTIPSLPLHGMLNVVTYCVNICVNKMCKWSLEEQDEKIVTEVILRLLAHHNVDIQEKMYETCHGYVKALLGVEQAKYTTRVGAERLKFLFNRTVLTEIICYGLCSTHPQVHTYAEEILLYLLKGHLLMTERYWFKLLEVMVPCFPLLQCYANKNSMLGRSISTLFELDISKDIPLMSLEVLKGNLRLMFSSDPLIREEAVPRLTMLLSGEEKSQEKLPHISSLNGAHLSMVFIIENQVDVTTMPLPLSMYQPGSLCQVLELFSSKYVEPHVRKSALNQMSVMSEDTLLHKVFYEQGGLEAVLDIMERCLIENDLKYYPDFIIPATCILKNLVHHNPKLRQELSQEKVIYFSLVRGMFLFRNDDKFRSDAAHLTSLLLYSDYILAIPNGVGERENPTWYKITIPEIILRKMRLPFICNTHWKTSQYRLSALNTYLIASHKNSWPTQEMLRTYWNIEWYNGPLELFSWDSIPQKYEFSEKLCLTKHDLVLLKTSAVQHCCKQQLYAIQNATTHQSVITGLTNLVGYLQLHALGECASDRSNKEMNLLVSLPWEVTFTRFLVTSPSCSDDKQLLANILGFFQLYVKCLPKQQTENIRTWLEGLFQDVSVMPGTILKDYKMAQESNAVQIALDPNAQISQTLYHETLVLIDQCILAEKKYEQVPNENNRVLNWIPVIECILQNLKSSETQYFYNLASLEWTLSCLVNLTGYEGWSEVCASEKTKVIELWSRFVCSLIELVTAFHCGTGGATSSFMGLGITKNAALCMNHILFDMQEKCESQTWEHIWLFTRCKDGQLEPDLMWLVLLWISRDPLVRAAGLQLVTGLSMSKRGAEVLLQSFNQISGGIWGAGLSFLLDHYEACVAREQAALLLANLTSHTAEQDYVSSTHSFSSDPEHLQANCTLENASELSPVVALLQHSNFFPEIYTLISKLYLGQTLEPVFLTSSSTGMEQSNKQLHSLSTLNLQLDSGIPKQIDEYRMSYASQFQDSSAVTGGPSFVGDKAREENVPVVFTAPCLAKAVCLLLINLLLLNPKEVIDNMKRFGIINVLLKCIRDVPNQKNIGENAILYVDILELYTNVCTVLTKCIQIDSEVCKIILQSQDNVQLVFSLLHVDNYCTTSNHIMCLRNKLWTEIFRLLSALLQAHDKSYNVIRNSMSFSCDSFLTSIKLTIMDRSSSDLRNSALTFLNCILSQEFQDVSTQRTMSLTDSNRLSSSFSVQSLLDEDSIISSNSKRESGVNSETFNQEVPGVELCSILIRLYDVYSLQCESKAKFTVATTLSNLLNLSREAKKFALKSGFMETLLTQLKEVYIKLSLESLESLRRVSDKKRVNPVIKELFVLVALFNNFLHDDITVKDAAAESGLADLVHKLWTWCCVIPNLLSSVLKLLCTFTANCLQASASLILTTTIPGVGLRKSPTSQSLLHSIIALTLKELNLVSRTNTSDLLILSLNLLKNACLVQECRVVMAKGSLFVGLDKIHPSLTKKQKHWDIIEILFLEFLQEFTYHAEGQVSLGKVPDALDVLIALSESSKHPTKTLAFCILRNVAFNSANKSRLLQSANFLKLVGKKIEDGTLEEKTIAANAIWSLIANNQKGKNIIKSNGLDLKLQECINHLNILSDVEEDKIEVLKYVHSILKTNESLKK